MKVKLINEMEKDFKDKFNGKEILIPAGKAAIVPDYVAYHFIGNPNVINGDDANAAQAEQKRVYLRYGAFKPDQRAERVPDLSIEEYEEEVVKIVEAPAKKAKKKAVESEFKELTK